MPQWPNSQHLFDPRFRGMVVEPRRAPRRRFRWGIVWFMVAILAALWLLKGVEVGFEWSDVQEWLHVRNTDRYTRLAVLGTSLVALILVIRVLRSK